MATTPLDIKSILDSVEAPREAKAAAWDAFHGASSPDDFRSRFDAIALPREAKAALWDSKFSTPAPGQTTPAASPQSPAVAPADPASSGAGVMEPFRRIGAMILGTEKQPTALGEIVYPMTATDPTRRRDLGAARSPMDAPPILDVSQLGASQALPARVPRGVAQGVEQFASGLTSPTNVMLMGGMGLLKAAPTLQKLASAGFSVDMLMGAYKENENFQAAVTAGDSEAAARALVGLTASAGMGVAAAKHAVVEQPRPVRVAPDTAAEAKASQAALATNEDLAIARVDPAQASKVVNQEIARRQAAGQWDATLEKTPTAEERRAAKKAQRVTVPEEGDPDPVLTYQRGNVAAELAGKPYEQLGPEERSAVDDLVKQGFGMREAKQPAPEVAGDAGSVPNVPSDVRGGVPGDNANNRVSEVQAGDGNPASEKTQAPVEPRQPTGAVVYGREADVRVPGERTKYKSVYAVREAEDVVPSHNPTNFEANPDYQHRNDRNYSDPQNAERIVKQAAEFDPGFLINDNPDATNGPPIIDANGNVLGGNSRTMTMTRVREQRPEAMAEYRRQLETKAKAFGLDPEMVRRMKNPVLVRQVAETNFDPQRAITDFNKVGTAELKVAERAVADSRRIGQETLDHIQSRIEEQGGEGTLAKALDGGDNRELLDRLQADGIITQGERPKLMNGDGSLTADGKGRVSRLLIGRLFEDARQLEDAAPDLKQRLERVVAPLARVAGKEGWDITQDVKDAVRLVEEARGRDVTVDDLVKQGGLFGDAGWSENAIALADVLKNEKPTEIARRFRQYANEAELRAGEQGMMFGEPPTPVDSFLESFVGERKPSPLQQLVEKGEEASKRLGKRLSSTSSANEFLNPATIRDMALSIAGDVALGALKAADIGRHLSKTYGPKARAVAAKVWETAKQIIQAMNPDGRGTRDRQRGSVTIGPIEPKAESAGAAPPKKTATAEAPAPPADGAIPVSPSYEKTKGRILDKAGVSDEAKAALAAEMQKWEAANPERRKITHAEIEANAKKADPSLLFDMDRKTAQETVIKDPALYHAARQLVVTLGDQAAALNEKIRTATKDTDTLELERRRDIAERDMQQLLGVTLGVRSQHGRNLAMHRMMVDKAGFDPGYWAARAKKGLGLPADANLPPEVQRDINAATAEGRAAEAEALGKLREKDAKRKTAEAAGAPVPKRKAERDPSKQKPTPEAAKPDTTTPPTPEEKAAIDADAKVQEAKRNLARKMAKLEQTTLLEAISSIRRAGLLTSPRTHARNFLGNFTMQALEETSRVPGAMLDIGLSLFSGQRVYAGASGKAVARATAAAATRGVQEARQVMRQGATDEQLAQFDMPKEMNLGNGRVSMVLEWYTNRVFRSMSAADRVFKRYAIQRSLEEQMKLAKVDAPTEAMMAQAIADADFATFNNENKVATMYSRAKAGATPGVRFAMDMAVPFVRTPANVLARVLDYSGGGLVKAGITGAKAAMDKAMTPEQQRYIAANFGRGVTGPALIYIGYQLAAAGLATGSYQADAGKRNADEAAGRLTGAVKIGDTWQMVSPLSPGGALITIGATLQREATGPIRDEAKRPGKLAAVVGRTVLDHPFLQGAKDIADAVTSPAQQGERALAGMAGSFVPSIVSDAASLSDNVRRDSRTDGGFVDAAAAAMAARTPGARNTLPERKDVLGRQLPQSGTAVLNPGIGSQAKEDNDPIIREIIRNKVAIGEPQRATNETLDQFRMRREILGREIEKQLGREIATPAYAKLDNEEERRATLDKAEKRARLLVAAKLGKRYAAADAATRQRMLSELLKAPR